MYIPIFEINNFILQPKVLPYQVIFKLQSYNDYFQSTFQFELIVISEYNCYFSRMHWMYKWVQITKESENCSRQHLKKITTKPVMTADEHVRRLKCLKL